MGRAAAVMLCLLWTGCDDASGNKSAGEACTRSEQCRKGLRCEMGACAPEDRGSPDAGASADGG